MMLCIDTIYLGSRMQEHVAVYVGYTKKTQIILYVCVLNRVIKHTHTLAHPLFSASHL